MIGQRGEPSVFERCVDRVARIRHRVESSDGLAYEAWRCIAASQKRLSPWPRIRGGSDDGLRERIRARLLGGTLPRIDGRAWAGKATGVNQCACCDTPIARGASEFEPQTHAGTYAHAECFGLWHVESDGMRGRESAAC